MRAFQGQHPNQATLKRNTWNMYRESYERECISWFMGTSDVLKVLKIPLAQIFATGAAKVRHY